MFYTYTEKVGNSFFGAWHMRAVAFDTRRRYLYYSEPIVVPETGSTASHTRATQAASSAAATVTSAAAAASARSSPAPSATAGPFMAEPVSPEADSPSTSPIPEHVLLTNVTWRRKLKVFGVVPVATVKVLKLSDAGLAENDLYQLEITGEPRAMATGEVPPVGPLLCPSAGLHAMEERCALSNPDFIKDPFFLKELFDALRDQFEELATEKVAAEAASAVAGRAPTASTTTLTITTPRGRAGGDPPAKKEKVLLRCRNEREFRRFWYVLQTVLGFDKLIVRPYRGLPPYDPRNMVAFAHIPMTVWHTFKALDKAVFYAFTRGDVMGGMDAQQKMTVDMHGCYMCVTHDMVYFMRDTGNIPRWIRLQEVSEFHYNVTATKPFFVFLSDPPVQDIIVVPLPPVFGPKAAAEYDPVFDVRRMQRVMHDTCFASLAIRRVVKLTEVKDASVQAYVVRMQASRRPLRLGQDTVFNSAMSCPLPKEQLAAVWYEVQQELVSMGNMMNRAAIPLYETNAPELQLSGDQLSNIARRLDDERERLDDVVGMPLERARQVESEPAAGRSHTGHHASSRRHHRDPLSDGSNTRRRASGAGAAALASPAALDGVAVMEDGAPRGLSPTAEMLSTPQLAGTYHRQQQEPQCREKSNDNSASSSFMSHDPNELSSYLVPGTRYITREEVEAGSGGRRRDSNNGNGNDGTGPRLTTPEWEALGVENHQEVERGSTVRGGVPPAAPHAGAATATKGHSGFLYGPERTVTEIVSESMAALGKQRSD